MANQGVHIGVLLACPAAPMAELIIGMVNAQVHMVKTVKRRFDVAMGIVFPTLPNFLSMAAWRLAPCLVRQERCPWLGVLSGLDFNVLQVRLADVKSLITRFTQGLRQGSLVQRKLNAVVAHAVT